MFWNGDGYCRGYSLPVLNQLVEEGHPEEIANTPQSLSSQYLKPFVP